MRKCRPRERATLEPKQDEQQDEDDDWSDTGDFFGNNFMYHEEDSNDGESHLAFHECILGESQEEDALQDLMLRLKRSNGDDDTVQDYRKRTRIVQAQMGNMTLCRGDRGKLLYKAGAIPALLSTLSQILDRLPPPDQAIQAENEQGMEVVILATCCWGAIRDLSCPNANVRSCCTNICL